MDKIDKIQQLIDNYLYEISKTVVNSDYDKGMIEGAEHYLLQLKHDIVNMKNDKL